MRTLRPIVAGTDFSACAEQALGVAIELAATTTPAGHITLVHVCEPDVDELDDLRLSRAKHALTELVSRYRHCAVEVSGVLRSGQPWRKLDNVAVEVGANLIVVGRHGGGRGRHTEFGSVAHLLLRSASRPVLTVPCQFNRLACEASENNQ